MTTEDRLAKLELLGLALGEMVNNHEQLLGRIVTVQEQQANLLRDLLSLVASIDDRLGSIERLLRERHTDGQAP